MDYCPNAIVTPWFNNNNIFRRWIRTYRKTPIFSLFSNASIGMLLELRNRWSKKHIHLLRWPIHITTTKIIHRQNILYFIAQIDTNNEHAFALFLQLSIWEMGCCIYKTLELNICFLIQVYCDTWNTISSVKHLYISIAIGQVKRNKQNVGCILFKVDSVALIQCTHFLAFWFTLVDIVHSHTLSSSHLQMHCWNSSIQSCN